MIKHIDPEELPRFGQSFGDSEVFTTGRGISGWVVVNQNHRRCCVFDGDPEDFSGMNEAGIERANGDLMGIDNLIFRVQRYDMKFFLT